MFGRYKDFPDGSRNIQKFYPWTFSTRKIKTELNENVRDRFGQKGDIIKIENQGRGLIMSTGSLPP